MFQHELEAAQRLHQADLVVDEQVVAISTECLRAEKQTRTTMRQPVWGGGGCPEKWEDERSTFKLFNFLKHAKIGQENNFTLFVLSH